MLSKRQKEVLDKLKQGAVIGELSSKVNGRYELFIRKKDFKSKSRNHSPFEIQRLNKNTVFALLELGHIKQDNFVETVMRPFSRDHWYVLSPASRSQYSYFIS